MDNKIIKYIAFYEHAQKSNENRQASLAAINKIDYICSALIRNQYSVEIISPSWTNNIKGMYRGSVIDISENVTLRTFFSFGTKNRILKLIKYVLSIILLTTFLIKNTKKNEQIIVYHSVILSLPIRIAKWIKGFKVILEVEEIYQDIQSISSYMKSDEYKAFDSADKFLLSTELLNKKINSVNKPNLAIYGAYYVEKEIKAEFEDDNIHVVYAGTFDPRKGGAQLAIDTVEYLPNNYHIHIIGFGTEEQTEDIRKQIEEVSLKSVATITYDGLFHGDEYIQFMQKCDIGLSTQIPNGNYIDSSFPSKILSYMANGLNVVTVYIEAIKISDIGNYVYYFEEYDPKSIAKVIMSVNISGSNSNKKIIRDLDNEFLKKIDNLLEYSNV